MRMTLILISLLFSYHSLPSAEEKNVEFWDLVSEYDSTIFNKKISQQTLEKLEKLAITSGGTLERKEVILKTIQHLEIHSSINALDEYMRSNIDTIGPKHTDYLMLDAKLRIISNIFANDSNSLKNSNYMNCETESCKRYSIALRLFLEKKPSQFKSLKKLCYQLCNFPLYHLAMMEFYKSIGDFVTLEEYSKNIIDNLLERELLTSDPLLIRYAMAYLSYSLNENGKVEASEFILTAALKDISPNSFAYTLTQFSSK
jgi:hypothetical protein